ncbi:MAG: DUF1330 domain-containing protein [Pseudomonadota bacterium]
MPALIIVDTKVHDPEAYEEYKALAKPLAEKHGARYLHRGGRMVVDRTDLWEPTRMVVIEFSSVEAAQAFMDDPEYAPVKALRHKYADSTLVIVETD